MDEHRLAELFRDATRDAPPASFDVAGVRSASARATARRRSALALGSTMAFVLVLGGVAASTDLLSSRNGSTDSAAAGSAQDVSSPNVPSLNAAEPDGPRQEASPDRGDEGSTKSIPGDSSTQGDDPSGSADRPPVGSAQRGCVEVDRELAVALADELPVANGVEPSTPDANCPVEARGAAFAVRDGDVHGTVSVVIAPPGALGLAPDGNVQVRTANTPGGDQLHVLSRPDEGSTAVPFAGELESIAQRLAARF
ncbi:hypothetical protein [Saccharothrix hoggarensis]|uniref:Uncharacterized protein n=1 Tax=Saccharothrix hoggarensis TaxID=913853 RepID=A0ABW3QU13_9PSEU